MPIVTDTALTPSDYLLDLNHTVTMPKLVSERAQRGTSLRSRAKGRRLLTCFHEGGHALTRWYFGHRVERVVVLTVADMQTGKMIENRRGTAMKCEGAVCGYDICSYPFHLPRSLPDDPEHTVFAQRWLANRDIDLIGCYAGISAEALHRRLPIWFCEQTGGEGDLQRAAEILSASGLSGAEQDALGEAVKAQATALVRSPMGRAAIRNMAAALFEQGELNGDEVASLCRSAYGDRECAFGAWSTH